MKLITIIFAVLFVSSNVLAGPDKDLKKPLKEVVQCDFTEPFISYKWNPNTKVLVRTDSVMEKDDVITTAPYVTVDYSALTIMDKKGGKVLLQILNKLGDNGMSDHHYPMQGVLPAFWGSRDLLGGCHTPKYQPWHSTQMLDEITPEGAEVK